MSKPKFLFAVYEGETRVYDGSSADVAAWLHMPDVNRLYTYVYGNHLWRRKYRIVKTFEEPRPRSTNVFIKPRKNGRRKLPKEQNMVVPENQFETYLNELIRRLTLNPNTFSWSNGEQFRKELEEAGIHFTSRRCSDGKGYILERI